MPVALAGVRRPARGCEMIFLANIYLEGAVFLVVGALLGYGLLRWKERILRTAQTLRQQAVLENACREAENIAREARLKANEEMLKIREQAEETLAARRQQLAENDRRLTERETLINCQLEHLVREEKC